MELVRLPALTQLTHKRVNALIAPPIVLHAHHPNAHHASNPYTFSMESVSLVAPSQPYLHKTPAFQILACITAIHTRTAA